jgi:hypothetical protein
MKSKLHSLSTSSSSSNNNNDNSNKPLTISCFQRKISDCLYGFLFQLPEETTVNSYEAIENLPVHKNYDDLSKEFLAAVDLVILFIQNLIKHPGIPRYRRITTTNANYKNTLQSFSFHKKLLESIGFKLNGTFYEWDWASIMDDTNNKAKLPVKETETTPIPIPTKEMIPTLLEDTISLLQTMKSAQGKKKFIEAIQLQKQKEKKETGITMGKSTENNNNTSDIQRDMMNLSSTTPKSAKKVNETVNQRGLSTPEKKKEDSSILEERTSNKEENVDGNEDSTTLKTIRSLKLDTNSNNNTQTPSSSSKNNYKMNLPLFPARTPSGSSIATSSLKFDDVSKYHLPLTFFV